MPGRVSLGGRLSAPWRRASAEVFLQSAFKGEQNAIGSGFVLVEFLFNGPARAASF